MKVKDVKLRRIFDSRGEPTIEIVILEKSGHEFAAQIPSGESRGSAEAKVFSFNEALRSLKKITLQFADRSFEAIAEADRLLFGLDATPDKSILGGNVTFGVSVASARAIAHERKEAVWKLIRDEFFPGSSGAVTPRIFSNFVEGGVHAANNLQIQEYLILTKPGIPAEESVNSLAELYKILGETLRKKFSAHLIPVGDEGGYVAEWRDSSEPIETLQELVHGSGAACRLGLDAAANNFYADGAYRLDGQTLSLSELLARYREYFKGNDLLYSIEDPCAEADRDGFMELKTAWSDRLIIGDDLTTTHADTIKLCGEGGLIGGVIIKPNQVGTITETCDAIKAAKKAGLEVIVSHRGRETEDVFIVQLAKACGADGVKIGAPARERILKFNEFIRLFGNTQ